MPSCCAVASNAAWALARTRCFGTLAMVCQTGGKSASCMAPVVARRTASTWGFQCCTSVFWAAPARRASSAWCRLHWSSKSCCSTPSTCGAWTATCGMGAGALSPGSQCLTNWCKYPSRLISMSGATGGAASCLVRATWAANDTDATLIQLSKTPISTSWPLSTRGWPSTVHNCLIKHEAMMNRDKR